MWWHAFGTPKAWLTRVGANQAFGVPKACHQKSRHFKLGTIMRMFCATAAVFALLASHSHAEDFKLEPGFTLLFNGKNLDGWKEASKKKESLDGKTEAYNGRFKVTDGRLVYDPEVKGDLYIETAKEFGKDVHIKFDFKAGPKCNNDVFLRGTKFDIIPANKENKNV